MTVLLDTNVVSELMRKAPDPTVAVWAAGHRLENLFFSAVGEAELRYGAAYPYLERDDISQALAYAAWRSEEQEVTVGSS